MSKTKSTQTNASVVEPTTRTQRKHVKQWAVINRTKLPTQYLVVGKIEPEGLLSKEVNGLYYFWIGLATKATQFETSKQAEAALEKVQDFYCETAEIKELYFLQ